MSTQEAEKEAVGKFEFCHKQVSVCVQQWRGRGDGGDLDEDMTGDLVWPTATIFCRYLCDRAAEFLNKKRVLDLGAGTGLVGLVARQLGCVSVTLTDVPRVLPLLEENVHAAAIATCGIVTAPLWWGDRVACEKLVSERVVFDVVLCCEVVYQHPSEVFDALLLTLKCLLPQPGGLIMIAYQPRDGAEFTDVVFFQNLLASGFELIRNESLSAWDGSWGDADFREVRIYRRCLEQ